MKKINSEIGLCKILFIVFLVLKLLGIISWSWWWVTAPLWGELSLAFVVIFVVGIIKEIKK